MGYGESNSEYWGVQPNGLYGITPYIAVDVQAGNRDIVTHSYGEDGLYYIKVNGYKREVGSLDVSDREYYLLNIKERIGGTSTGAKQKFIV